MFSGLMSGLGIQYSPSMITSVITDEPAPTTLEVGKRIPPQYILRAADSNLADVHDLLPADGRFKILVFPGKLVTGDDARELVNLASKLENVLKKYPSDVFSTGVVLAAIDQSFNYMDVPLSLRPDWKR